MIKILNLTKYAKTNFFCLVTLIHLTKGKLGQISHDQSVQSGRIDYVFKKY